MNAPQSLPSHVDRMLVERYTLMEKIIALQTFIETSMFSTLAKDEQLDLREQLAHMDRYCRVLERRIHRASSVMPSQLERPDDAIARHNEQYRNPQTGSQRDEYATSTQEIASALTPSPATAEPIKSIEQGGGGDFAGGGSSGSFDSGSSGSDSGSSSSAASGD